MTIESERDRLIDAALGHAIFDGMNDKAIAAAARDLGMDPALAQVYLPQGGAGLAAAFHRRGDAALRRWLKETPPTGRFRDRITAAVMQRLEGADRELVRGGAAILALPQHAALGARLLWESADTIWSGLGDRSEDVNWYSKRATLSAVYGATVLYWLGDESADHSQTRAFLDRRIDGVMRFESLKAFARKVPGMGMLGDLATGWIRKPVNRNLPGQIHPDTLTTGPKGDHE
ncbi:COQ9 family protein [Paracoccus sp. (in: a-proteobacteria)]|uniref:COQ9 family protein n=1 Tax=Paracoccus sp. TaxID=267 RepID=UPI002899E9D4|nr:COQ9 family protein [Paracoccus sp. (in: a-proteobacteria)]